MSVFEEFILNDIIIHVKSHILIGHTPIKMRYYQEHSRQQFPNAQPFEDNYYPYQQRHSSVK